MNDVYYCIVQLVNGENVYIKSIGKPRLEEDVYKIMGAPCSRKGIPDPTSGNFIFERCRVSHIYYGTIPREEK